MKNKAMGLLTLLFGMGVFFMSNVTVYAASDTEPPSISAYVNESILTVEAYDDTGVEAVYVGGQRFNYLVDGSLELPLQEYAGTGKTVAVYAVDYAGNHSETLEIDNPYYTAPGSTTSGGNPFTPDGTGTVQDNATDGDEKEFFTITTADENVFYLIIDRQRESENVYFLNAVTEQDLLSLAQQSGSATTGESAIPVAEPEPEPEVGDTGEEEPEPEPVADSGTSMGTIIFLILAAAVFGAAGYYFKILKPRQETALDDDEEDEDESEYPDEDFLDEIGDGPELPDDDTYLPDTYGDGTDEDGGIPEDELTDPEE